MPLLLWLQRPVALPLLLLLRLLMVALAERIALELAWTPAAWLACPGIAACRCISC